EDGELVPSGGKWTNAGYVLGPQRAIAWRVLDAQYFGVAQRRRRVFVVASARKGFDPAEVLFEFEGVRRDSPPSREAGAIAAAGTLRSADGGSDADHARAGHLQPVLCVAHGQGGAEIAEGRSPTLTCNHEAPIAVYAFAENSRAELRLENGDGHITGALTTGGGKAGQGSPCIVFSCKDYGNDATENLPPTPRAMVHSGSHANAGAQLAVCVTGEVTHTFRAEGFDGSEDGTGRGNPIVPAQYGMAVRRLMPIECERLQGFPDGHTMVPVRNKPAADGPRYKALGNSMAVPCMAWIGRRIQQTIEGTPNA